MSENLLFVQIKSWKYDNICIEAVHSQRNSRRICGMIYVAFKFRLMQMMRILFINDFRSINQIMHRNYAQTNLTQIMFMTQ